jgi:fructose-bisphosphate aldolase class II
VRKINIDTDNRMAITAAIRQVFVEKPGEFDPRSYLKPAKEAMRSVCRQRFQEFGAEGMAGKITPMSMAQMAKRYASGELAPRIGVSAKAAE